MIPAHKNKLTELSVVLSKVRMDIETITGELEAEFDEMSEAKQDGPKGQNKQEEIEALTEITENIETCIDLIGEAMGG